MKTAELKLRLRDERSRVPGLASFLRTHNSVFSVEAGVVRLLNDKSNGHGVAASGDAHGTAAGDALQQVATLTRLRTLSLPDALTDGELVPLDTLREVIVLDLDNHAFVTLERAAQHAAAHDGVLIVAGCSSAHNPRIPLAVAEQIQRLGAEGRLRLLSPARDCTNAADFVLAFWVGWLHAHAHEAARFVLVSEDASLEQTVAGVLSGQGRRVLSNPTSFLPP
jgi:hypothetical protein